MGQEIGNRQIDFATHIIFTYNLKSFSIIGDLYNQERLITKYHLLYGNVIALFIFFLTPSKREKKKKQLKKWNIFNFLDYKDCNNYKSYFWYLYSKWQKNIRTNKSLFMNTCNLSHFLQISPKIWEIFLNLHRLFFPHYFGHIFIRRRKNSKSTLFKMTTSGFDTPDHICI